MPSIPKVGSQALRKGRFSEAGHRYFITFKTTPESENLNSSSILNAFNSTIEQAESDQVLQSIAFTIMPDHVHLLFQLGEHLTLGKTIARLKFKIRTLAKPHTIFWQSGYYDHKLRSDEEEHPVLHYIYMNPYCEKLISSDQSWPYTCFQSETWKWFKTTLNKDCPYPEWLDK